MFRDCSARERSGRRRVSRRISTRWERPSPCRCNQRDPQGNTRRGARHQEEEASRRRRRGCYDHRWQRGCQKIEIEHQRDNFTRIGPSKPASSFLFCTFQSYRALFTHGGHQANRPFRRGCDLTNHRICKPFHEDRNEDQQAKENHVTALAHDIHAALCPGGQCQLLFVILGADTHNALSWRRPWRPKPVAKWPLIPVHVVQRASLCKISKARQSFRACLHRSCV
mmetsp:Transcript_10055/g.24103  ORF Transcript_10055/g.24103 Transcript_10055/m.24103 type:complete len:225 (+) Transcript_10055:538-1212(+)